MKMPIYTTQYKSTSNDTSNMPTTVSDLYNLAIDLNMNLTSILKDIHSAAPDKSKRIIKNLLYYQQAEKTKLVELLHRELNNCYRAFYDHRKNSITVLRSSQDDSPQSHLFINKSLDTFAERINNFGYICREHKDLSDVDLLVLYLGLRDYCANFFQQMAVNYQDKNMMAICNELVGLIDQVSDEIGLAYSSQKR